MDNNMDKRLIEVDFPLKQTSLDSVHEKNVRHGHISTLHIWPARRPVAASRAALIATLLPDPGNEEERKMIMEKLAGHVVEHVKKKKRPNGHVEEQVTVETEGGILHWGRESSADLQWFRDKIREAYGGRAPRILDPFAGGGAIPLEAMRLGCEVTAVDINPVAWFILKCTLEYPQRLANQLRPLPDFACQSRDFMESYFKAKGLKGAALEVQLTSLGLQKDQTSQLQLTGIQTHVASVEADLAWHVRAWGWWVLQQARTDLARFYPTVDGKPTVAYLWARTVTCKNCRATVPLLKTRWLCKRDSKRVVLTMEPNADKTGVVFGVQNDAPSLAKGSSAQKREYDKQLAGGTMSRSGATCPCCSTIMTMEDIRRESQAGRTGTIMTSVIVDSKGGRKYRLPIENEIFMADEAEKEVSETFASIPFGLPDEPTPKGGNGASRAFSVDGYGLDKWFKLFTPRQLLTLGKFI
jgi:putative DNA methylase